MSTKLPDWVLRPPKDPQDVLRILKANRSSLSETGPVGQALRQMLARIEKQYKNAEHQAKKANPLPFIKPSYDQALVLNAWIWGYTFICIFSANRIGKTFVQILDKILWIFPNDPRGIMFKGYTDDQGRHVRTFPRHSIEDPKRIAAFLKRNPHIKFNPFVQPYEQENQEALQALQNEFPDIFDVPPEPGISPWGTDSGVIWQGGQDVDTHKYILFPIWRSLLPQRSILKDSITDKVIEFAPTPVSRWTLVGKSYESEDTKWASGAVDIINLTEGIPPAHFQEVKARFKDPGIGGWDFTPYEGVNAGPKSKLAEDVYKGKEEVPLNKIVFTGFTIYDAPAHVLPPDKKADLIRIYKDSPQAAARLDGKFYSTSPLVLSNLDRNVQGLQWTKDELFRRYPEARLYRFLDLGQDHPTVCVWAALLPTNCWVIYRVFSQRGLTIDQRCARVIELSNNTRHKRYYGGATPYKRSYVWEECHTLPDSEVYVATVGDYHVFKTDEVNDLPYVYHYHHAGLPLVESSHLGPEERAEVTDSALGPDFTIGHLETNIPPGYRIYFLVNEYGVANFLAKLEGLYWDRYVQGPHKGEPKGKIPTLKDDELDALSYLAVSGFVWTPYQPSAKMANDDEEDLASIGIVKTARGDEDEDIRKIATIAKENNLPLFE